MGREVRLVTKDWNHPRDENGKFIPLVSYEVYELCLEDWKKGIGEKPIKEEFMPKMEGDLYMMMYENTSEGTPLSPAFKTPEELAKWCVDNNVSTFGKSCFATYEQWLNMIEKGSAVSAVLTPDGEIKSGVEYLN